MDTLDQFLLQEEAAQDARRARRLKQMKGIALGFLLGAVLIYALAQAMLGQHPAWGYVAAFAEAAMIGAIADWFAVVALFRHPLGVPLWHTAIIPNSKKDIGHNLGQFIVTHFVTVEGIVARVRDYAPASKFGDWLQQSGNSARIGQLLGETAAAVLNALDDTRMRSLVRETVLKRLQSIDVSNAAAGLLDTLVRERRHQQLFDGLLRLAQEKLSDEDNHAKVADFIGNAMDLNSNRVIGLTVRSIIDSVTPRMINTFLRKSQEALDDPEHPWRLQLDIYAIDLMMHLKADPKWHENIEQTKQVLLAEPQLAAYLDALWDDAKAKMLAELSEPQSPLARQIEGLAFMLGEKMSHDQALQQWINQAILREVAPLVEQHRGAVARFITRQIDAWSEEEMTRRVELAIGRDLQFIRINGTLVGGLVGLVIYALTQLLRG